MMEEVRRWINHAERDLITAMNNLKTNDYYAASFWCQQSVEKGFKALLIYKTNKFPKIHDLTKLAKLNNAPKEIILLSAKINPAYTASRYPDVAREYTKQEAELTIKFCRKVLEWIKKILNY